MSKLTGLFLAFLLATFGVTGCGGDESDDSGSDSSGSADRADADSGEDSGDDSGDDSGGDSGDSGDDVFDVCGLLEVADLEAAFGPPWDEGEATHMEQTGGDQCIWGNSNPPPVKQFSVVVYRDGHFSEGFESAGITVESLYNDTKELMTDIEELDLGDDSYISGSTIHVLDGDMSYEFSTVLGTSPEAVAGLRTLAEQVMS
jgi:hypothetical protein